MEINVNKISAQDFATGHETATIVKKGLFVRDNAAINIFGSI